MRYAIFSDIHSNLEAYEACLEVMASENIDCYVCLGDIVGYGANPKECIGLTETLIKDKGSICIAGNHDAGVSEMTPISNFNTFAREAVLWTRKIINEDENRFLSSLPLLKKEGEMVFVHASIYKPEEWHYIYTLDDAYKNFEVLSERICFMGHTHIPVIFKAGKHFEHYISSTTIEKDSRYIVNVGSVGQPRDRDSRSCFVIYDTETSAIEYRRVEYNISKAQAKIVQAHLPGILATRLGVGE